MSDQPSNITLERVNRLTQAIADLSESHASQGRSIIRLVTQMSEQLTALTKEVHALAGEQILLGNRIEDAFTRALQVNIRIDELEDNK